MDNFYLVSNKNKCETCGPTLFQVQLVFDMIVNQLCTRLKSEVKSISKWVIWFSLGKQLHWQCNVQPCLEIEKRGNHVSSISNRYRDIVTDSVTLVAWTDAGEVAGNDDHVGFMLTSMGIDASAVEDALVVVNIDGFTEIDTDVVSDDNGGGNMGNFFNQFILGFPDFTSTKYRMDVYRFVVFNSHCFVLRSATIIKQIQFLEQVRLETGQK